MPSPLSLSSSSSIFSSNSSGIHTANRTLSTQVRCSIKIPPFPSITMTTLRNFYDKLLRNPITKILLIYLCLNTLGLLLQVVVAWTSNSLALLGHTFHTMFDCIGIVVACTGEIYFDHKDEDEIFSFGLSRVPVLAAFTNASFLFFTAI